MLTHAHSGVYLLQTPCGPSPVGYPARAGRRIHRLCSIEVGLSSRHLILSTVMLTVRCIHRLVPVSASCVTNLPEIQALCRSALTSFFARNAEKRYTVSQLDVY